MKKNLLFACIIAAFLFPVSLYAESPNTDFYVGIGPSYALEDIKEANLDNSFGADAKFGFHANRFLDVEFNLDWLRKFEDSDFELEIMTLMFTLKGYFPFSSGPLRLSVVAGGGQMYADAEAGVNNKLFPSDAYNNEIDFCGKLGLAFDYYVIPEFSFGVEGNYTFGLENLKDINYWNLTIGAAYHF
jgi:hypothetical protein